MRIAMMAAEAAPCVKVGGLGDVVGALPKALERQGAAVSVIVPRHGAGSWEGSVAGRVPRLDVPMGGRVERADITEARMRGSAVRVYAIASRKYFDREGVYDDPATGEGYPDNPERFLFFMRAAVELVRALGVPFDILHCHDAHAALVPALVHPRYAPAGAGDFARTGTLLTIHNLAHQGICPPETLDHAGIAARHFHPGSPFEYWGRLNFMKAGIELADRVNTVSPTYAVEIRSGPEAGCGLEGVLAGRSAALSGIVNGIDYEEWNPESDPHIAAPYSARDLAGKEACRRDLRAFFRLEERPVPLVGIVSRLADQKGLDLVAEAADGLLALDLQLVVLGTGQRKYHDLLEAVAARHPGRVGVRLAFDNALAHRIEAGCDIFLMPSRYEPCGLNQLYSLRYGTVPVVRRTGGLADTVTPWDGARGTGFLFEDYSAGALVDAVRRALGAYADRDEWRRLVVRCMRQDWSWERSARRYLDLYREIRRDDR
ncbi:MAG: glycogen synthase GlgA [Acidobacteria bacterium]|nr:glycogen synthase GlgA [Acidobacteriota bacterium]